MSEARTVDRIERLETDVAEIKQTLTRLEPLIIRIDERLNTELPHLRIELSHLATKAEVSALDGKLSTAIADKPSHGYLWGVMAAMVGAQAVALAAAGWLFALVTHG